MRVLNLAKNVAKSDDFQIDLFFTKGHNVYSKNSKIYFSSYFGTPDSTLYYLSSTIHKTIQSICKKYDIIHCFKPLPTSVTPSYLLKYLKKSKVVMDWDDFEGSGGFADQDSRIRAKIIDYFEKTSIKNANCVVTVSKFLKKRAINLGHDKKSIHIIPNGCDLTLFDHKLKAKNLKIKFNGKLILMYVGILFKSSDLDLVLGSIKEVIKYRKDVLLLIIGDGPKRTYYEQLCKIYGIESHILFLGYVPHKNIPQYLSIADVLCLPMKKTLVNEARFPIKLGEYMSMGKAIVTNPMGVVKEYILDNINGLISDFNEIHYANSILSLLNDPDVRIKLGKNARLTAENKLNWVKISNQVIEVYRGLC